MNMKNSLQKRTPVQNLQMAVGTACAMGTAAMMSTVMAYADVSTAIDKVFNVGNQVSNSIAKGLTNVVVPIGIAVFLYLLEALLQQRGLLLIAVHLQSIAENQTAQCVVVILHQRDPPRPQLLGKLLHVHSSLNILFVYIL